MTTKTQTKVTWEFWLIPPEKETCVDTRMHVPANGSEGDRVLEKVRIESVLYRHPSGRCVRVEVLGRELANNEPNHCIYTNHFLDTTSGRFDGLFIWPNDSLGQNYYWLLLHDESFLDGAIRIGRTIFKGLSAYSKETTDDPDWFIGQFNVSKHTFISRADMVQRFPKADLNVSTETYPWYPIEAYLRLHFGLAPEAV